MSAHPYFDSPAPRVLAHRGLTTVEDAHAENSVAAVVKAVAAGSLYVESDCHLTLDGEVVLFHDATALRVAGDPRPIAELTLAELRTLMEDRGGLLTLADALDGFPDTRWNLDVKAAAAAEPVGRLIAPHAERVLVTSFSDERRRAALAACATAPGSHGRPATSAGTSTIVRALAAATIGSRRRAADALRHVDALQIPERQGAVRVLTDRLLAAAGAAGAEVHVWTVNDPERMRELVARGVSGIVTDRADIALEALA